MNTKESLKQEYVVEINDVDAHITLRCTTCATAKELVKRLYPVTYIEDRENGVSYIFKAKGEADAGNAFGTINPVNVPVRWVTNRRVDEQKAA